jgi:hypothetical protein
MEVTTSSKQVEQSMASLRDSLLTAIKAHESAPRFDASRESERLRIFRRMLEDAVGLGKTAVANEAKLLVVFQGWKKANGDAAPIFRKAEEHFHNKAMAESRPRAKDFYKKSELWYAARAARAELRARSTVPTDFTEQVANVKGMLAATEDVLGFVKADPFYLEEVADEGEDLRAFFNAFTSVEQVLDDWTKKLVEDLEAEQPVKP